MTMLIKAKYCYHMHRLQLTHLWCGLIICANLLGFGKLMVHAINPNGQWRPQTPAAAASSLLPTWHRQTVHSTTSLRTISNQATDDFDPATGYHVLSDERAERHVNRRDDIYSHLDVMLTSNETSIKTDFVGTNVSSSENELHQGKGTVRGYQTVSLLPVSTTIAATQSQHYDFNHSIADDMTSNASTFLEDCLANRNSLAHVFTVALYSVVCVVGLFGNTLVIWVVFRFSKMQTVTNIYILNLAIADECFLIGIPFLLYTMRICSWKFGEYVCKAYMVSTSITQFTSSIFLLIMAADRYIAVCHPIESQKYRTLGIAKFVSMLAWFTSAILMLPVILFASTVRQEDGINFSCNIDWPEVYKKHSGTTFILYTFLLGFATPLCFILVFYYLVIRKLHTMQKKHKSKEKKRSHRKVTRLVLTVITVYILCWLPHWVSQVSLINSFVVHRELTRVEILLFLLFGCLAYSNSAMNPILYAFLSDNFRKSFSKAFSCVGSHEVEAQLINEHSVYTHKRTGSVTHKRKGSRRLSVPRGTQVMHNNSFLAPTTVHNSGGGSSSATSASTATTATDKSSNSNNKLKKDKSDVEKITLVVNCERVGKCHQQQRGENQTDL